MKWPHECPGQDRATESGGQQTECSGRAERLHRVPHALGGVVHVLKDSVAEHGVVPTAPDHVEQAEDVSLDSVDPVGDPGLGGTALQREQRVGARVDDGDPVAQACDGNGEVARTATRVQYVQGVPAGRLDLAVESVFEDLPDHSGTEGGTGAQLVRHGS